jgi:4a-hydroxytetrahydrobiopterin dehydratase
MARSVSDLAAKKCQACEGGVAPLEEAEIRSLLKQLEGWELAGGRIAKTYEFKNYYQALAFVNATAWISHREDHHPDIVLGYNRARVEYVTHAINGLSENDFICAAKLDKLFQL